MPELGVVQRLARYPVKSMRGESLSTTSLTWLGIPGDRRYAFVQAENHSGFPWLTARQFPQLLLYRPEVEGAGSEGYPVTVTTPGGKKWPADSEELRSELEKQSGRALFLMRNYCGCYDAAPVSLISRQTVARVAAESGTPEEAWRFRPNVLVDLTGGEAFEELRWAGRILRIGATARIAITKPDERCKIITLDPATGEASPAILQCVARNHQSQAGVYATVLTPGEIREGDPLRLED